MKAITITIDGPAGSGKGTTARGVATRLGYIYIDSGSLYRAITHQALKRGIDHDGEELRALLPTLDLAIGNDWQVELDGETLPDEVLRTPEINRYVSTVFARIDAVRNKVTDICQAMIDQGGYVLDGRDAATTIAPDAELKIYLDADPRERARRRALEHGETSDEAIETMLNEVITPRDTADQHTLAASQALGTVVDTTELTPEEQIARVYDMAMEIINE